jgi:hypothetical protein
MAFHKTELALGFSLSVPCSARNVSNRSSFAFVVRTRNLALGEGLGTAPGLDDGAAPVGRNQADRDPVLIVQLLAEEPARGREVLPRLAANGSGIGDAPRLLDSLQHAQRLRRRGK